MPEILNRCHVLVRPSLLEGMPLAVLEAMAAGLPVVATSVGGTPELVTDGRSGLLVPPADSEALARALLRLAREQELRESLASSALQIVSKEHSLRRSIEANLAVYSEIVGPNATTKHRPKAA